MRKIDECALLVSGNQSNFSLFYRYDSSGLYLPTSDTDAGTFFVGAGSKAQNKTSILKFIPQKMVSVLSSAIRRRSNRVAVTAVSSWVR